jgi:hypothetical protein
MVINQRREMAEVTIGTEDENNDTPVNYTLNSM